MDISVTGSVVYSLQDFRFRILVYWMIKLIKLIELIGLTLLHAICHDYANCQTELIAVKNRSHSQNGLI
jgi:hypothetical protein